MAICDLYSSISQLQRATKQLSDKWEETKTHWDDQNRRDFEQQFLRPLLPQVTMTVAETYRLAELFAKAERDCEDRNTGE